MVIVIADDFSGATEMAGIGWRYGLKAEVQLEADVNSSADLIVIDANTRSMSEADAVRKTRELSAELKKASGPFRLFKKVDSVMRGYIVAETNVLQKEFGYKRVLLLPANPTRGRKIMRGAYYVNGITLDQTIFSADPDFPMQSALVEKAINAKSSTLPYQHINRGDQLPDSSFVSGDVETKDDLKQYVSQTDDKDLCVGAAECLEAFLEHLGYKALSATGEGKKAPYTFVINGSTVKITGERSLLTKQNIPYSPIPDEQGDSHWHQTVLQLLKERSIAVVGIDNPLNRDDSNPTYFSDRLVKLAGSISDALGPESIHFGLTGGATASAIIRSMDIKRLAVKREIVPGVVTVASEKGLFTVKPGSYPWPESFFDGPL